MSGAHTLGICGREGRMSAREAKDVEAVGVEKK